MKTDRFADSIRRKLDSIRPEFTERDWVRMQATLNQAGPSPNAPTPSAHPFAGPAAKLAAAGFIGTAVFLTTTIWQHYELKHLHQTLQQVTQKTARADTATVADQAEAGSIQNSAALNQTRQSQTPVVNQNDNALVESGNESVQRDTVYVDRYVSMPASVLKRQVEGLPKSANPSERLASERRSTQPTISSEPTQSTDLPANRQATTTNSQWEPPSSVLPEPEERLVHGQQKPLAVSGTSHQPGNPRPDRAGHFSSPLKSNSSITDYESPSDPDRLAQTTRKGKLPTIETIDQTALSNRSETGNGSPAEPTQPVATYELASALPMHVNEIHWNDLMAQRAKKIRSAKTTVVNAPTATVAGAPASQPIKSFPIRFRIGAGVDVNTQMWSSGGYADVLAGKWMLSLGLSRAIFKTNTFQTDFDFDLNTKEDFRRLYARGIDPRHDILNIQTHTARVQLPITLAYRVPINQTFAVLPSVGASLNLQSQEFVSFIYHDPFRGYNFVDYQITRPVDLLNNLTFGAGLEWKQKHWVAQGGPVISVPFFSDPNCKQNVTAGLKVRLFYQF